MADKEELSGLEGWLILVGIGVVFTPIRLFLGAWMLYPPIFKDGTWEALTTAGSDAYHPLWASLLIGEIAFNVVMLAVSIYMVYLFFSKHHLFPKLFIAVVSISLAFIPLDSWMVESIYPTEGVFDPATTKEFVRTLVVALIWVPYMLVSKRVKATFVKNAPSVEEISASH